MLFRRFVLAALFTGAVVPAALAQSADQPVSGQPATGLNVELNAVQDIDGSCRLSFLVTNQTATAIEKALFETVIFDAGGSVSSLSLFDFRSLPVERPRVRQFDLPDRSCASVGQILINGANSCVVDGIENDICRDALTLSSRVEMELLG